jgi:ubiquinone/menaquinone biosynthesis C-methylase UbiE
VVALDTAGCDHRRVPAADDPKQRVEALFDLLSADYDASGVDFFQVFGRRLVEIAGLRPGQQVLDVGAGRGAVVFPAAKAVGPAGSVQAIDLAPAMVDLLRQEIAERGLTNADARVGDAEAPGGPDGSFDAVLASLVLFFLPDVPRALRAFHAALRPGGVLGFTTFGDTDPRWKPLEDLLVEAGGGEDRGVRRPVSDPLGSPAEIVETLEVAGFVDIDVHDEVHRTLFASPEQWRAWTHSTGGRTLIMRIPPDRRDDAVARAMALVDTLRGDDGLIGEDVTVRYTVARRP